jgi:hypothetical protein
MLRQTFLGQLLERLTTEAHSGRACSRVDVSRAGMVLIAAEVVIIPVTAGVRGLVPGIPVDFFVDPTLDDLEVRLARPIGAPDAHVARA